MLETIAAIARGAHVVFGFAGLAAFWVPVFARKGASVHRTAGKIFVWCAYVVLGMAAVALLSRLVHALVGGYGPAEQPMLFAFIAFLGYLTVVTFVTVRHGRSLLEHKRDPRELRTPLNLALVFASIAASAGVVAYALVYDPPIKVLLFALSPIGVLNGMGILRYLRAREISAREWWYEHMGAMLGAGIAFHTAFAVFGANRLFNIDLDGFIQVIPWILPAAIGIPATAIWTRHYRRKFGELA